MYRSKVDMMSSRHTLLAAAALALITFCSAGPLGPLPNVTSADLGLKEGGCAVGDVVYAVGEQFPGAAACERCACAAAGRVRCERERCTPRAGCKALHRPDHCCPTYQCECEQEGRVYGNGEKLVDPQDPCRVCYCQGGEVVCRRIACFLRDDCSPRLVPGRCCPEYDNCPLRGVTTVPGATPSISTLDEMTSSIAPSPPKENVKQEITIKEITPVSEIPIITEVKIKEILPSPAIEVPDYSSSKSPLMVREATSETTAATHLNTKTEPPFVVSVKPVATADAEIASSLHNDTKMSKINSEVKTENDSPPSKISLSTQDSINSDIYPSIMSSIPTMGSPSITPEVTAAAVTNKAPIIEEEDPTLFDHNPAFPPLPDDLSVPGNHEDEIVPEQPADGEHVTAAQETTSSATAATPVPPAASTARVHPVDPVTRAATTASDSSITSALPDTTAAVSLNVVETSTHLSNIGDLETADGQSTATSQSVGNDLTTFPLEAINGAETTKKNSPMLNLRSAIPTEILNVPSFVPEEITGELDDVTESSTAAVRAESVFTSISSTGSESVIKVDDQTTQQITENTGAESSPVTTEAYITSPTMSDTTVSYPSSTHVPPQETSSSEAKSNIVTEITAQTEFSSIPIETSDQNPQKNTEKQKTVVSTSDPLPADKATTKISTPLETEVITVSRATPSNTDNQSYENVETTEFILTPFGSSESATDAVELIKISAEPDKSAAFIHPPQNRQPSVLTDLINLVGEFGDVASTGDQTEGPEPSRSPALSSESSPAIVSPTALAGISDSEELIPVNAGYKSKNSNWNVNSITEIPIKSKNSPPVNKQKVVEIEDEDSDNITDSSPPDDKVEPTTRRPIIDNVADDGHPGNNTDKKDIEIITKSYVPTINRRPTKVIMKKSNDKPVTEQTTESESAATTAVEKEALLARSETTTSGAATGTAETSTTAEEGSTTADSLPAGNAATATTGVDRDTQPPAAGSTMGH